MRRDDLYLSDIIEAVGHVATFLAGVDELTSRYPQVPWPQMVAFRNILIHAYFGVDWNEVWKAARLDCPILRGQAARILAAEFTEVAGEDGN